MNKHNSILGAALAIAFIAVTAQAQQEIHSNVPVTEAIAIPGNQATAVTHIDLPCGEWMISGLINFYESAERGTVFVGGAIVVDGVNIEVDGTTLFTSTQLDQATNAVLGLGLPSRLIKVPRAGGGTTPVNLVAWSHQPGQPPPDAIAWGFISAFRLSGGE